MRRRITVQREVLQGFGGRRGIALRCALQPAHLAPAQLLVHDLAQALDSTVLLRDLADVIPQMTRFEIHAESLPRRETSVVDERECSAIPEAGRASPN
jgi:hypothetical protein